MKLKGLVIIIALVLGAGSLTACSRSDHAYQNDESTVAIVEEIDTKVSDNEKELNVEDGKHKVGDTISMTSDDAEERVTSEENISSDTDVIVTTVGDVKIPIDMISDTDELEEITDLSGYYCGMGQSNLTISIYTSQEDIAVGNAEVYIGDGEYAYKGELVELMTNIYQLVNDSDDEVLMRVYTEVDSDESSVYIHLYVNGEYIENYIMKERFES